MNVPSRAANGYTRGTIKISGIPHRGLDPEHVLVCTANFNLGDISDRANNAHILDLPFWPNKSDNFFSSITSGLP